MLKNVSNHKLKMVQSLTSDNFSLQNGGQKMVCDVSGVLMVMFKTEKCPHSKGFFPYYAKLSKQDTRLAFACIDVVLNKKIIGMAKGTKTPITEVPTFILYYNGSPFARYKGGVKDGVGKLAAFIDKMLDKIMPTEGAYASGGPASAFMNNHTPSSGVTASYGTPLDDEPNRPILPSGITKTPHNAPYLAYISR